ncbi:hypothetical protein [Helicobacter sp. MIT 14-3879]|uniref:hypothetical protein n=1 Tax=Helicobacter sp. MIT 14-3879 TaxID=2040649 RepID=UPI000E1E370F|nr:hypothetical protein [Helicobacter sp. MIT 14-3879]RDU61435.1 hypothetical protein CQA44_08995 [Helicobacter sp. MIT 14-3879]
MNVFSIRICQNEGKNSYPEREMIMRKAKRLCLMYYMGKYPQTITLSDKAILIKIWKDKVEEIRRRDKKRNLDIKAMNKEAHNMGEN